MSEQSTTPERPTADEARHRLYEIMKADESFEEKARRALELGTEYLDVDSGFVTRIDRERDHWETIASTDDADGMVPVGVVKDLGGTLCRHTLERDSPLAIHDAQAEGWGEDPAVQGGGIECYHGTTLTVDGDPFGTVCLVSGAPRADPFDEAETMFAELLGRLLEHELEYRHQRAELDRQTNQINVLDRVLRHNIRNDMSVIRARAQLARERYDDCTECVQIQEKADELVDLSETARELGTIVNTDFERQERDIVALLERTIADVEKEYPTATIRLDSPETLSVAAMSPLQKALRELLDNAAKHSEDATVTVTVRETADDISIQIVDDGPGLPETEQEVLDTGTETPLVHGSGLGLWTVHWVVTGHDGSIEATSSDDGTTVTVTLPREAPETAGIDEGPELRVKRAHDRYEAVFENAADPLLIFDDNGRCIDANENVADLLGLSEQDIIGRHLRSLLPDESEFEAVWDQFCTTEGHGRLELARQDGSRQTVEYAPTLDIVPGQHLALLHEIED